MPFIDNTLTPADIPRILTALSAFFGMLYCAYLIRKFDGYIVEYAVPVFLWFGHEFTFYAVYYMTHRFADAIDIYFIQIWPQVLRTHVIFTILSLLFVMQRRLKKWMDS